MTLIPHTSRFFPGTALTFPYDPEARCPQFLRFMNQILPKRSDGDNRIPVLQEFAGYCLLPSCKFETMLILLGQGANGKSTFLSVVERLLGESNVSHVPFDDLGRQFRLGDLQGKLANITSDLPYMSRTNEGLLKQIISGEPVTVDRKFKTPVTVSLSAKLLVACNEVPAIADTTDGMWRRMIVVPFDVAIREEDRKRGLADELCEELPGIFNWAVEGLKRLIRQNGFSKCEVCDQVAGEHRVRSDVVADFIDACCVLDPTRGSYIQALYDTFVTFCDETGRKPVALPQFGMRMHRHKVERVRCTQAMSLAEAGRRYYYAGIALTPAGTSVASRAEREGLSGWNANNISFDLPATTKGSGRTTRSKKTKTRKKGG